MNQRPDQNIFIGDETLDLQAALTGTLSTFMQAHGVNEIQTQERDYTTPTTLQFVRTSEHDLHRLNTEILEHFKNSIGIAQNGMSLLTESGETPADLLEIADKIHALGFEIENTTLDENLAGANLESLIELQHKITRTLDPMFQEMAVIVDLVPTTAADDENFHIDVPDTNSSIIINNRDIVHLRKILGEVPATDADTDLKNYAANAVEVGEMLQALQELRHVQDTQFILSTLNDWAGNLKELRDPANEIGAAYLEHRLNATATYDFAHALRMIEKLPDGEPTYLRSRAQAGAVRAFVTSSELSFDNATYATLSNATKADHFKAFMDAATRNELTMSTLLTMGAKITEQPAVLLENVNPSLRARLDSLPQAPAAAAALMSQQIDVMPAETEDKLFESLKKIRDSLGAPNAQQATPVSSQSAPRNLPQSIQNFDRVWSATYQALVDMIETAHPESEPTNPSYRDLMTRLEGASKFYDQLMSAADNAELQDGKTLTRYRRQVVNAIRLVRDLAQSPVFDEARAKLALELKKTQALKTPSAITFDRIIALGAQLSLIQARGDIIGDLESAGNQFLYAQARSHPAVIARRGALYEQLNARFAERQDEQQDAITEEQRKQIITRAFDEIHADQDVMNILSGLRVSYVPVDAKSSKELRNIVAKAAENRDEVLEQIDNRWRHEQFTADVAAKEGQLSWLAQRAQNKKTKKADKERAKIDSRLNQVMQNLADLSHAYMDYVEKRAQAAQSIATPQAQEAAPKVEAPKVEESKAAVAPERDEHAERLANLDRVMAQPIVDADGRTLVQPAQIDPAELERRKRSMAAAMSVGGTAPQAATVGPVPGFLTADNRADRASQLEPLTPGEGDDGTLPGLLQRLRDKQVSEQAARQTPVDDQVLPVSADDRLVPAQATRRKRSLAQNLNTRARATARKLRSRAAEASIAAERVAPEGAAIAKKLKIGMPTNVKNALGAVLIGAKGDLAWAGNVLGSLGRIAPGIVVGAASGVGVRIGIGAAAAFTGSIFLAGAPLVAVTLVTAMVVGRYMGRGTARFSALNRQSLQADNSWSNAVSAPLRNLVQTIKENFNGDLKALHTDAKDKFGDLMTNAYAQVKQREIDGKQTRTAKTLNAVMFYPRLWSAANRIDQQTFALRVGTSIGMWSAAAGALVTHALMASPVDLPAGVNQWNVHEAQTDKLFDLTDRAGTYITPLQEPTIDAPAPIDTPVRIESTPLGSAPGKTITDRLESGPAIVTAPPEVVTAPPTVVVTPPAEVVTAPPAAVTAPAPVAVPTPPVTTEPLPLPEEVSVAPAPRPTVAPAQEATAPTRPRASRPTATRPSVTQPERAPRPRVAHHQVARPSAAVQPVGGNDATIKSLRNQGYSAWEETAGPNKGKVMYDRGGDMSRVYGGDTSNPLENVGRDVGNFFDDMAGRVKGMFNGTSDPVRPVQAEIAAPSGRTFGAQISRSLGERLQATGLSRNQLNILLAQADKGHPQAIASLQGYSRLMVSEISQGNLPPLNKADVSVLQRLEKMSTGFNPKPRR